MISTSEIRWHKEIVKTNWKMNPITAPSLHNTIMWRRCRNFSFFAVSIGKLVLPLILPYTRKASHPFTECFPQTKKKKRNRISKKIITKINPYLKFLLIFFLF